MISTQTALLAPEDNSGITTVLAGSVASSRVEVKVDLVLLELTVVGTILEDTMLACLVVSSRAEVTVDLVLIRPTVVDTLPEDVLVDIVG
jgi:hypothetical protein